MAIEIIRLFHANEKNKGVDVLDQSISELASAASRRYFDQEYSKYIQMAKKCYATMIVNAATNLNVPYNRVVVNPNEEECPGALNIKCVNNNRMTLYFILKELIKRKAKTRTIDNLILNDVVKVLDFTGSGDFAKYYGLLNNSTDNLSNYNVDIDVRSSDNIHRLAPINPNYEFMLLCTALGFSKLVDLLITLSGVKVATDVKY